MNMTLKIDHLTQLTVQNSSPLRGRAYAHIEALCFAASTASAPLSKTLSSLPVFNPAAAGLNGSAAHPHRVNRSKGDRA